MSSPYDRHKRIANSADNHRCNDTRGHAVLEEVDVAEVQLAHVVLLGRPAPFVSQCNSIEAVGATHAVWFGKPETGMPMPVEQMRPVMKMRRLDLSPPGMLFPTCCAIGTSSTLAMVWLMNVEMTCDVRQHAKLYER